MNLLTLRIFLKTFIISAFAINASAASFGGFEYTDNGADITIDGCTGGVCPSAMNIPATIIGKPVLTIGGSAFVGKSITSLTLPNGLVTISGAAFVTNQITTVIIPNSVTTIGANAFTNNLLASVSFGTGVTTVGANSFQTNALTSVVFEGPRPTFSTDVFAANAPLTTISYRAGQVGWPGAAVQGITPTVLAIIVPPTPTTQVAVPSTPLYFSLIIALMLLAMGINKARTIPTA